MPLKVVYDPKQHQVVISGTGIPMYQLLNRILPEDKRFYDYNVRQRQSFLEGLNLSVPIPSCVPQFDASKMVIHVLPEHGVLMLEVEVIGNVEVPIVYPKKDNV
jgi:hypothetical protein